MFGVQISFQREIGAPQNEIDHSISFREQIGGINLEHVRKVFFIKKYLPCFKTIILCTLPCCFEMNKIDNKKIAITY